MKMPTRKTLLQAMDEFREIDEKEFYRRYNRRRSRSRYLRHDGVDYPVKVLWASAHRPALEGRMQETGAIERQLAALGFNEFVRSGDTDAGGGDATGIGADGFDAGSLEDNRQAFDARKRGMVEVLLRPQQGEFRRKLIETYGRCMVSGCRVENVLDAAHIIPFRDIRTSNHLSNGLLISVDIHRLFDCGLIAIDPDHNFRILLHNKLRNSLYKRRHRQELRLPEDRRLRLSKEALRQHKKSTGIEW